MSPIKERSIIKAQVIIQSTHCRYSVECWKIGAVHPSLVEQALRFKIKGLPLKTHALLKSIWSNSPCNMSATFAKAILRKIDTEIVGELFYTGILKAM